MNILILGNGGREHTFCWKLSQSPQKPTLFTAPGNAGTAALGTNLAISPTDFEAVAEAATKNQIKEPSLIFWAFLNIICTITHYFTVYSELFLSRFPT